MIVASGASNYCIRAVIFPRFKDLTTKPIAHASRTLPAERNYNQIEKEIHAINYVIKKFHRFIHGRKFSLQLDHRLFLTIFGSKKDIPTRIANRLRRCGIILLNFNFKREFLSKILWHADELSRLIPKLSKPLEDTVIVALSDEKELSVLCNTIRELPMTVEDIRKQLIKTNSFFKN